MNTSKAYLGDGAYVELEPGPDEDGEPTPQLRAPAPPMRAQVQAQRRADKAKREALLLAALEYFQETTSHGPNPLAAGARLRLAAKTYGAACAEAGRLV